MADAFTSATPTYRAAQALNQARGPAMTVYPPRRSTLRRVAHFIGSGLAVFGFVVAMIALAVAVGGS